jgi:hypothetical protein
MTRVNLRRDIGRAPRFTAAALGLTITSPKLKTRFPARAGRTSTFAAKFQPSLYFPVNH